MQTIHVNPTPATVFMYAIEFPLFEITKAIPVNNRIGMIYAIVPKSPNNTEETASPTNPPIPKLLINSKILAAKADKMIISSFKKLWLSCFFFVCFLFLFLLVFFLAAMKLPLVS